MATESDKPINEEEPQVFAVSNEANEVKFTRRDFLELAAATSAALALTGCSAPGAKAPTEAPTGALSTVASPSAKAPTATKTKAPAATKTKAPTLTPTPRPEAMVQPSSINMRSGPGTQYSIVKILEKGDVLEVLGRNQKGTWLQVRTRAGEEGWVALSVVEFSGSVDDLEVAAAPPPPSQGSDQSGGPSAGAEGQTPPGQTGADYTITDANGVTRTYTLPCGSPIPAGAVCVCNCVTVPSSCSCDTVCTCDAVCTCVGASHYWYPN